MREGERNTHTELYLPPLRVRHGKHKVSVSGRFLGTEKDNVELQFGKFRKSSPRESIVESNFPEQRRP